MNRKAIVVYLDDDVKNIEEYSWLYKTWYLNSLYDEYDIVVYGPSSVQSKIDKHDNIIFRELEPVYINDKFWENYKFANSFAMFNNKEEMDWILKYDYILKTDCDVFLTENLKGVTPEKLHIGLGGYMMLNQEEIVENLIKISKRLNFKYKSINHVGASLFGKTSLVSLLTYAHFKITKYILQDFGYNKGSWPGWYRGVSSMYAIHLVVNNFCDITQIKMNVLDEFCSKLPITKDTYHIHAWHYDGYFSKHKWFRGEYDKLVVNKIPSIANEYCHWIASNSLEEILKVKKENDMKLAVIIPYRNREEHLKVFLEEFPKKINVKDYIIIVVEQTEEKLFNRAKLLNIGFDFIKDKIDYVCFHDVDMIPIEADYSYSDIPLHMATNASQFMGVYYNSYYGGVNLMSKNNFITINGFSNDFWGWGAEDDDLRDRVELHGFKNIKRKGVFKSLDHKVSDKNNRSANVAKLNSNYDKNKEGLNTLEYKILEEINLNGFTIKIKVEI